MLCVDVNTQLEQWCCEEMTGRAEVILRQACSKQEVFAAQLDAIGLEYRSEFGKVRAKHWQRVWDAEMQVDVLHWSSDAGVAQLVERQPSKLNVAGSNPVTRFAPSTGMASVASAHRQPALR